MVYCQTEPSSETWEEAYATSYDKLENAWDCEAY